ncbi:alkaline phosphatase D family protein [Sphingobium yanoikuyae]|uniref:Alkaline phosphatase D family protein n=1 Tax=Sphingobium yanoikuyae TaxID=13690 RepID=A0A9X7UG46_SPHYA|nr:alkaline phosphatase D family protein [Sphingobium yanoikuyae]QNG48719.1 alkaline phosphatase D family protein [Sphingobium yanoikuyae]
MIVALSHPDRRATLGASALPSSAFSQTDDTGAAPDIVFLHGVASGDPLADRVILWTRATPKGAAIAGPVEVKWEVARDTSFRHIVRQGALTTGPEQDYTVKVDADHLQPNRQYHYRFRCGDVMSPVGITRTLPKSGQTEEMVLAIASCSFFATGFFNAYREISALNQVDLVLHLGDYIYDYGSAPEELGMSVGLKIGRIPTPANETITLADYRERYACYRLDPDLQAAHARAPWICVWDDHESANDAWQGGAQNHQPNEGDWGTRRAAAVRAYYEWIPIREPGSGKPFEAINRSFELGDLATLIMLESRLLARSRQLSLGNPEDLPRKVFDTTDPAKPKPIEDPQIVAQLLAQARQGAVSAPYVVRPDVEAFKRKLADPKRQLLGAEQEAWLRDEVAASVRAGKRWQLIGNQVVMARTAMPDIVATMGEEKWQAARAELPGGIRAAVEAVVRAGNKLPSGLDGWNGYPAARARMDEMLAQAGARPIVFSGDSHAFWVNELSGAPGQRIAAEIGTTAITSSSLGDLLGGFDIGPAITAASAEVLYNNQIAKGFALLTLNREEARVDLISVSTVLSREYTPRTIASFRISPSEGSGIQPIQRV